MIRSRGFRQIRARALPLLIVTALVPLAAGAGEGWVRIPLEGRFTALSLGQGGASAVVIEEVTGDAALVDTVSGSADRPEIRATQILAVLPLPEDAGHLVVGLTRKGDTAVSHLDPDTDGRQVPSRLIEVPVRVDGAALGQDLALYLRALDSPFIARLELCETDELEIEGCRERTSSGYGATIFEVPGPPAADLVADAASDIVIAVQHGTPEVVGLDARHGKTLFAQVFADLEPPLRLAGAIGGRATLFVSAPRSGSVEIFDIDRDFRELSPAGRIDLGALGDTPTPTISLDDFAGLEGSGSDPEAWWQLAGKVAVGPEQDVVLIAGLEPDTIHVIVRTRSTNRLALDLRSEQAEVLDFALSPDGGHFGILLDGLLIVSPVRALMALADSAGVGRSVDVNAAEKAITSALQTRLSQEGFYRGVVDGVWGPESQAALSRFQARNGIDTKPLRRPSEADAATLGALFADNLENLPVDAFGPERAQAAREAAFARFFARNLPRVRYFSPSEIFISGRGNAEAKCGALNALPDEELWPAILPAVRRLDVLRAALGKTIWVLSSFQTTDYAECVGTPEALIAPHGAFSAIEFLVDGLRPTPDEATRLAQLAGDPNDLTVRAGAGSFHLAVSANTLPLEQLSDWQAVVASYRPGSGGCAEAQAIVEEFAELLSGTGLEGAQIYIARTKISDHYAVTVDTGDSPERARQAVAIIQKIAPKSANGRTGVDAFPQVNKGWWIDDRCRRVSVLD